MHQRLREVVLFLFLVCAKSKRQSAMQTRPEKCDRSAEFMYRQCCVFPPFFTKDVAKNCGAIFAVNFIDKQHNITALTRRMLSEGCDHWRCVLNKYGFVTSDGSLDDEKYFNHLDKWVELNPTFSTVLTNAQVHCKDAYRMFMPLSICEFNKMHGCIRNFVNLDCPTTIPTQGCREKKLFYDECREYFL